MLKHRMNAIWTKRIFVLVMALMLCTGVFAVSSAAEADPLKPADVTSSDGNITLHKQAERIGPDEWEVTVSATVNQTPVEPPELEVVFVLDDTPLNNPTAFRYGVEQNGVTQMTEMNFPIPEATYALSSVQVKWVDENGAELTIPGYTPT